MIEVKNLKKNLKGLQVLNGIDYKVGKRRKDRYYRSQRLRKKYVSALPESAGGAYKRRDLV